MTQILREQKMVKKFVAFFGQGSKNLNVMDRAEQVQITEAYTQATGLFYHGSEVPEYSKVVELDLNKVEPWLAHPDPRTKFL